MRISVPLVLVFVWARVTLKPNILMTVHMSIEVSFVLETSTTSFVFAHEPEFCLMCDLMLLQSAFEWEALTTVFTDETRIVLQTFYHTVHNQLSHGPSCDVHLVS